MARRVPILAKLLGAYLIPTVATFAGFGLFAHVTAHRALEAELGRRLAGLAAAAAAQVADENVALLQPGDEGTRTYRNLQRRLEELRGATGVQRLYVFASDGTSRCDTRAGVPIGERYFHLEGDRAELRDVWQGRTAASVLFTGHDGRLYKSGFAPLKSEGGAVEFAVAVDAPASFYDELAQFRRALVGVGALGALAVIALSIVVARLLTRPIRRLEAAAHAIGQGDLEAPVEKSSRDEIGTVAETMEAMRAQLQSRDERMQMMLAGIAHEVRNPLAGMELYAGLLREDLDGEKLDHVKRIERELSHLKTIVGDFLEYARRPRPVLEPRDVPELLSEVRELVLPLGKERNVPIELDAQPARAACDAGQLRRALLNLLQNAVQACPTDGSGKVLLQCTKNGGGTVDIVIRDTGHGIDPERLDKIWTPFYTTKQKGTGLGLAFVRDIVREHNARIEVKSSSGGTQFTLTLPEKNGERA